MSSLIARAMFYPSLAYSMALSKCTSRAWYNRVDDTVVIGALPFRSMTKELIQEENIKAVLSMNESYELKLTNTSQEWGSLGVDHLQLSTVDLIGTPTLAKLKRGVEFIQAHRGPTETTQGERSKEAPPKGSVYVHCKAGRTRSATVVVCYLIKVNNWSPEKAYAYLKQCRPHVWLREKQMNSVREFYKDMD